MRDGSGFVSGGLERMGDILKKSAKSGTKQITDTAKAASTQVGIPVPASKPIGEQQKPKDMGGVLEKNTVQKISTPQQPNPASQSLPSEQQPNSQPETEKIDTLKKQLELESQKMHTSGYFNPTFVEGVKQIQQKREEEYTNRDRQAEEKKGLPELTAKQQKEELLSRVFRSRREKEGKGVQG